MDSQSVKRFLKELRPGSEIVDNGSWVNTNCPLAPWTHSKGTDSNPSFGVFVGTPSHFNCLACHKAGSMKHLLDLLEDYSGEEHPNLRRQIEGGDMLAPRLYDPWESEYSTEDSAEVPLDKEMISILYDKASDSSAALEYLSKRGIDPDTADYLGLMFDPSDSRGVERVLFPVRKPDGTLVGLTGRAINPSVNPKVRDYHGLRKESNLLGAQCLPDSTDPLVLVEGLIDQAIVTQAGYDCVASLHANLTEYQAEMLIEAGRPVIIFYDDDRAGYLGTEVAVSRLYGLVPVMCVTYPHDLEGGDPGGMSKEDIQYMVDNAKLSNPHTHAS